jgi:hypothetical protein
MHRKLRVALRFAPIGVLAIGFMAGEWAHALQPDAASKDAAAAGEVADCGPATDPNMPERSSPPGLPIRWSYGDHGTIPEVHFNGALASSLGNPAIYLGFNDRGAWLQHPESGKFYVWNVKDRSLTWVADQLPSLNVLLSWKNQNSNLQYMRMTYRADNQTMEGPAPNNRVLPAQHGDPNLPCIVGGGPGIQWNYTHIALGVGAAPQATFSPSNTSGDYLGYNEQGAWFLGADNNLYVWNRATGRVTVNPNGRLAPSSLSNPSFPYRQMIKRGLTAP